MDPTIDLAAKIRDVPNWPREGILFRDICPLLNDIAAFRHAVEMMAKHYSRKRVDAVAAIEARGFIFGAPLALNLGASFVPVRKRGKLPAETVNVEYALEYGTDSVEMHRDAIAPGARVLVVDDLLATGGTAVATIKLVEKLGGHVVGAAFLIELSELKGRSRLKEYDVVSLIRY